MRSKLDIRKEMRHLRQQVDAESRAAASRTLCEKILARPDVQRAVSLKQPFAVYLASERELDLTPLIAALWAADVTVAVPRWNAAQGCYSLVAYDPTTTLIEGAHHIYEPAEANEIACVDVGVWIVPGLAFTRSGARLGYGGGWYDRMLAQTSPEALKMGVCYPFQLVDELPVEVYDQPLTCIVTTEEEL